MIAFVLSGGSILGSAQVGALRALMEHHIYPDMLVGTSSGALNVAYLARDCSLAQVNRLEHIWRNVTRADIYPGNQLEIGWRLWSGEDGLYDNQTFAQFLQQQGFDLETTFASHCALPLYLTATHLESGKLKIFGEDGDECLLDALMASTALPPMHPPWIIDGERYLDGGLITPLPLRVALARGATEIYALYVYEQPSADQLSQMVRGVSALLVRSISMTMQNLVKYDLMLAMHTPGVQLHNIHIPVDDAPAIVDFSHADRLVAVGYQRVCSYLEQHSPRHRRLQLKTPRVAPALNGSAAATAPATTSPANLVPVATAPLQS